MSFSVQHYHHLLNRTLSNAHRPVKVTGELVKANASRDRVFLEVASEGHRLQCGTSRPVKPFQPGEPITLAVDRPPKIWRNGNVGVWLPTYAIKRTQRDEDPNVKQARRQAQLTTLKNQALLQKQKETHTLRQVRRVFLVTARQSEAYADFCDELQKATHVQWQIQSLDTVMQGHDCVPSVQKAFHTIQRRVHDADVVVVTRGGGSPEDLAAFDNLALAQCIATCPLPVLTAIGHHRDQSLSDAVAYHACKTPTAAATYLVHHLQLLCNPVTRQLDFAKRVVSRNIEQRQQRLTHYMHRLARLRTARPLARKLHLADLLHHIRALLHAARQGRALQCYVSTLGTPSHALTTTKALSRYVSQPVRVTFPSGWMVEGRLSRVSSSSSLPPDTM